MKSSLASILKNIDVRKIAPVIIIALMATFFILLCADSVSYKSRTRDEHRHMVRGIMLLETWDYRLNKHHPIFANTLNAVPAVLNDQLVVPSTDSEAWENADKDTLAGELVEINGGSRFFVPDILNWSRLITSAFIAVTTVALGFVIWKEWGSIVAVIWAALMLFEPNIIANSRLVTTDAWIVPLVFGATLTLYFYMKSSTRARLILFIILSFLSLITKYSAVPIALLWLLLLWFHEMQKSKDKKFIKRSLLALKIPTLIILSWIILMTAAYGFQFKTMADTNYADVERTEAHLDNISGLTKSVSFLRAPLQNAYTSLKLPFAEYFIGFFENVLLHDAYGHDSFLYGMYAKTGWWYYFPLALFVKMPVSIIIGVLALAVVTAKKILAQKPKLIQSIKSYRLKPSHILIIVPFFFFLLSMRSNINLGVRHILVVFPFLFLALAVYTAKFLRKGAIPIVIVSILGLWFAVSTFSIHPHYLEYFNEIAGGPENGYRYLLDSNLSWGQDAFLVEDYVSEAQLENDVHVNPLNEVSDGIVVIDVDLLMGRDVAKREKTSWLREPLLSGEIEPIDRIAYTYMVFEIEE